jgi:hypothetical protein
VAKHIEKNRPAVLKAVKKLRTLQIIKEGPTGVLMPARADA